MCFAAPGRIVHIENTTATLDYDGIPATADISLLPSAKPGDYVLVQARLAIELIPHAKWPRCARR
ncbi:MAG: HypC/HybG/HupF family hydrogenase formation chaperone [Nitrosarchaeum sp.]|nr:HypC/HybG/HupF family hydrogenase formation chaperone [Nitrosarchaeum sp.]